MDMAGKRSYHSQSGVDMFQSDKEYTLIHYIQIRFGWARPGDEGPPCRMEISRLSGNWE